MFFALLVIACSTSSDAQTIEPPVVTPLTAEQEQALRDEYGQIALRNRQASDPTTIALVDQVIAARVEGQADLRGYSFGSSEFLALMETQTTLLWALYAHSSPEALETYLQWSREPWHDSLPDDFRALADRNRETVSEAHRQIVGRLVSCQTEITRRLIGSQESEADLNRRLRQQADRYWAMLGPNVPQRDIEVHTALTCHRLA